MERRIKATITKAILTPEFIHRVGIGSHQLAEELSARMMDALGIRVCYSRLELDPRILASDTLEAGDYVAFTEKHMLEDLWEQIKERAILEITQTEERSRFFTHIDMAFPAITKLD
jgi:hypothetical protein